MLEGTKPKILIVEAESITAMSIAGALELWGYEVCELATSGEDALRMVNAHRPDLALLNVKLRGEMNGIELATRLRKLFGIPVVFISGYNDIKIRKQAEDAGASGYLLKPVELPLLKSALEHAFSGLQKTK